MGDGFCRGKVAGFDGDRGKVRDTRGWHGFYTFPAQYGQGVSQELTGVRQVALRVDVISE